MGISDFTSVRYFIFFLGIFKIFDLTIFFWILWGVYLVKVLLYYLSIYLYISRTKYGRCNLLLSI